MKIWFIAVLAMSTLCVSLPRGMTEFKSFDTFKEMLSDTYNYISDVAGSATKNFKKQSDDMLIERALKKDMIPVV